MGRRELVPVDAMMRALTEAKTLQDLITLASKAEALRHYARRAKLGLEAQNRCAEIKLRAERQLGGLLAETARSPGQRDQMFRGGTFRPPKLSELGIDDRKVSHRAQAIASVPERQFERYITQANEITTADVLRIAKATKRHRQARRRFKGGLVSDLESFAAAGQRVGTIYADPPWLYQNQGTRAATRNHYPGMTVKELCDLPVAQIAADDAHLHLWTTNAFLFDCPKIIAAWGFEFRSSFVWVKSQVGIGNYWRNAHEFLLTAVRGNAKAFNDRNPGQSAPQTHSDSFMTGTCSRNF